MKSERYRMRIARTPLAREVAGKLMVTNDFGKARRQFQAQVYIATDPTLGNSKAQEEALENAAINWYSLAGNGTTGGPSGTTGRSKLIWGLKSDGVTSKTYFVIITAVDVLDDSMTTGGTGDKFAVQLDMVEAGDGTNTISTSG